MIGDFQDTVDGFFVQEEDTDADAVTATSEGIFVYSTTAVDEGDRVQVSGTVTEYYGETEISSVTNVSIVSTGNTLPTAASPTIPVSAVSDWERFEGMRVDFSQPLFVTELYNLGRYGQLTLADQRIYQPTHLAAPGTAANNVAADNLLHTIILDDGSQEENPDTIRWPAPAGLSASNTVRGGDSVSNIEGVLTYRHDFYRIYPTTDPTFSGTNPRGCITYQWHATSDQLQRIELFQRAHLPYISWCGHFPRIYPSARQDHLRNPWFGCRCNWIDGN